MLTKDSKQHGSQGLPGMPKEKRDWFGDIFLWSLIATVVGLLLTSATGSQEIRTITGLAMTVFGSIVMLLLAVRISLVVVQITYSKHKKKRL